jgi:hypothetical protein
MNGRTKNEGGVMAQIQVDIAPSGRAGALDARSRDHFVRDCELKA